MEATASSSGDVGRTSGRTHQRVLHARPEALRMHPEALRAHPEALSSPAP
jgi:hypothetical protein